MSCSACFGENIIFFAIIWYIYRGFCVFLAILRSHRSPVHLEQNRIIYSLRQQKHEVKNNLFNMMDSQLQISIIFYPIWELHHWNEKRAPQRWNLEGTSSCSSLFRLPNKTDFLGTIMTLLENITGTWREF